jgi:signal transduction histidine kinase
MGWAEELRQAFERLGRGEAARVEFGARADRAGEIGREFNALADGLTARGTNSLTREEVHRLRNRLAGLLAALHVLAETSGADEAERVALKQAAQAAQALDARLRAG